MSRTLRRSGMAAGAALCFLLAACGSGGTRGDAGEGDDRDVADGGGDEAIGQDGDAAESDEPAGDGIEEEAAGGDATDGGEGDDGGDEDGPEGDASEEDGPGPYPPERCTYFLAGEVDLAGTDADGDGAPNGWDHCPNNPFDWLDSDRDGIGNRSDPDMDGDGVPNGEDPDRDGDGVGDAAESAAGADPADPSSLPGVRRFDLDLGARSTSPGWYKGDLHVHTEYSHDSSAPLSSYFPAARDAGLDFLCITDHDVFDAPFDPAWDQRLLLLVPGIEWGGGGGHANIWGLRTLVDNATETPGDIRGAWRLARLQGGVQSLNHYGAQKAAWDALFGAAPDLLGALDVIEVWNSVWAFQTAANEPSIALWEGLLSGGHHVGAVGGGDTHSALLTLGSPTTVVWAESLTVPGILHGIRSGRTYVTQADPLVFTGRPELDFRADADGDGVFEAMLGDEVPPGVVTLQVDVRDAKGPVVLVRSGEEIARFGGHAEGAHVSHTLVDTAPPGAWYRVEMRQSVLPFSPMRLFSSAIYVGE